MIIKDNIVFHENSKNGTITVGIAQIIYGREFPYVIQFPHIEAFRQFLIICNAWMNDRANNPIAKLINEIDKIDSL